MEIELLGHGLDWWNGALLFALVLAAVAAFAVVATTTGVIIVQKREARASAEKLATTELALEQLRKKVGPRRIEAAAFLKSLEGKPNAPVEIMFPKENGEAFQLAIQFRDLFRAAQWAVSEPIPVPPTDIPRLANQPSHMAAGGQPVGIAVVVRADSQQDFKQYSDQATATPANAISAAILGAFGGVSGMAAGPEVFQAPPQGTVRIVVGPKP